MMLVLKKYLIMYAKEKNEVPCLKQGSKMNNFCKNFLLEAHYLNQNSRSPTSLFELELGDADYTF